MSGVLLPYRNHLPRIAPDAFVAPNAALIGRVEVLAHANIWFGCTLRGDVGLIHVGANTNVQDGTVVHCTGIPGGDTWIGDNITIGHLALIHACRLEDGCFIGMKSCVMDGAVVESGAWVAAGAVVTPGKRVKSGELWAGTPAKFFRKLTAEDQHTIRVSAERYVELAATYRPD
jgi:carbonic anhydrase/acetyltransferase-like protein (isoleucine patch superfamily)